MTHALQTTFALVTALSFAACEPTPADTPANPPLPAQPEAAAAPEPAPEPEPPKPEPLVELRAHLDAMGNCPKDAAPPSIDEAAMLELQSTPEGRAELRALMEQIIKVQRACTAPNPSTQ